MEKKHLPVMGVGPMYVILIIFFTVGGIVLKETGLIKCGTVEFMKVSFAIVGIILIIIGSILWTKANFQSKIDSNIKNNTLVTTGVYAYVRNPIYSAFTMICTGMLLLMNNLWLLILPVLYWLFMTILMKNTEEKWLKDLYGQDYIEYCKRVNRCIPWPNNK